MEHRIIIREAEIADIERIVDIYNEALLVSPYVQDNHPHTIEKRTNWYRQRQSEGLPIFVAVDSNEQLIGFANLNMFLTPEYDSTVHVSVYVAAGNRGLGIGRLLIEELVTWSKSNGKHTVLAGIDAENLASIRLHESLGFTKVACFQQVIKKFDRFRDLEFYQLLLSEVKF